MSPDVTVVICPQTSSPLSRSGDDLVSAAGTRYPLADGVPILLTSPSQPEIDPRLPLLLDRLPHLGWQAALGEAFRDEPGLLTYVRDPGRARFLDLLPIAGSRVLEVGPGLGQFTRVMARSARRVEALELNPLQARFVLASCQEEALSNVSVTCGGDTCTLPYADGQFDVVVASLVFEWCGGYSEQGHEHAQALFLREAQRVLAPGGVLYLSTKNRYGLRLLMGATDEHMSQLRFGSALPRALATALLRLLGRPAPKGRLYSHRTLRRKLGEAGFGKVSSYWAAPEVRYPAAFVPVDGASVRAARRTGLREGHGRKERLAMRFIPDAAVHHVAHGLVFVATKPGAP